MFKLTYFNLIMTDELYLYNISLYYKSCILKLMQTINFSDDYNFNPFYMSYWSVFVRWRQLSCLKWFSQKAWLWHLCIFVPLWSMLRYDLLMLQIDVGSQKLDYIELWIGIVSHHLLFTICIHLCNPLHFWFDHVYLYPITQSNPFVQNHFVYFYDVWLILSYISCSTGERLKHVLWIFIHGK